MWLYPRLRQLPGLRYQDTALIIPVREYIHCELNQQVRSISGYYCITKEVRLPYRGGEILYLVGAAVVDSSCLSWDGYIPPAYCGAAAVGILSIDQYL